MSGWDWVPGAIMEDEEEGNYDDDAMEVEEEEEEEAPPPPRRSVLGVRSPDMLSAQDTPKRRMVGELEQKEAVNAHYVPADVEDCKGLLAAAFRETYVGAPPVGEGDAGGAYVDFDLGVPTWTIALDDEARRALGFSTLEVRLPRVPWRASLVAYVLLLQDEVEAEALGVSAEYTARPIVLGMVAWLASQGAFYALLHYEQGTLWHDYQAAVGDSRHTVDRTLPFCECAPGWYIRDGALPRDHPHRRLSPEELARLDPAHFIVYPTSPYAPQHRLPFFRWLHGQLTLETYDLDRARLLGWLRQAERALIPMAIPDALLPGPVVDILNAVRIASEVREAGSKLSEEARNPLALFDMTLIFGLWTLQGGF